jgi:hypothetical protein
MMRGFTLNVSVGGLRVPLNPTPWTLHPELYTLNPTPWTLHPEPYTLNPKPWALHPEPFTLNPTPWTLHPEPYTLNPTPWTLHPEPYTLNPKTLPRHPPTWEPKAIKTHQMQPSSVHRKAWTANPLHMKPFTWSLMPKCPIPRNFTP